ncbi:MAG: hypothetical protein ABI647_20225 [Gemmatimonadota bacterium]
MSTSQLYRVSGLGLLIGAVGFVVHVVLRSLITAGLDPSAFATQGLWVPVNGLGLASALLVLLGLPAMYAAVAGSMGRLGFLGVVLFAVVWIFFGVFLSLYGVLLLPWLAEKAPALVAAGAPPPPSFVIAFVVGLVAWLVGAALLAIPFIRGRLQPRWVGYALLASAVWMVVGNLIIAPAGPATDLAINLLSNLGPVLLLVPIGHLGSRMWAAGAPANPVERSIDPSRR